MTIRRALEAAGALVVVHDDFFRPDATDVEWLREAGRRKWVILTKDGRIRTRTLERIALERAGVHAFFLGSRQLNGRAMAEAFALALPAMNRAISAARRPLWMSVHRDGRLSALLRDGE